MHHLPALTMGIAPLLRECTGGLHKQYVSRVEMEVVLFLEDAVFHQDIVAHLAIDLIRRDDRDVCTEAILFRKV